MQDERFSLTNKVYGQYFQLYFQRLTLVAGPLLAQAQKRWPNVRGAFTLTPGPRGAASTRRASSCRLLPAARRIARVRACVPAPRAFPPRKP